MGDERAWSDGDLIADCLEATLVGAASGRKNNALRSSVVGEWLVEQNPIMLPPYTRKVTCAHTTRTPRSAHGIIKWTEAS